MRYVRVRAWLVAGIVLGLWAGRPVWTAEPKTGGKEDDRSALAQAGEELERLYSELEVSYRQIPRETFDPLAVIEGVGRDPDAITRWVREHTAWAPYSGALKGACGVLSDKAGSSLDRAILLAEILGQGGFEVRLVRGTLPEARARTLLDGASPPASAAGRAPQAGGLESRAVELAEALEAALRQAGSALGDEEADAALRLAAARDHWWVERQSGGKWIGHDVASDGRPLLDTPEEWFPAPARDRKLLLPARFVHEVVVKVIIEAWEEGQLVEKEAVFALLRPAELGTRAVTLRHHPMSMSGRSATQGEPLDPTRESVAALKRRALAEREWLPVLIAGDRSFASSSFDDAGRLRPKPDLSAPAQLAQATGGIGVGLGASLGGDTGGDEAPTSALTAEWLDFELRSPGREPRRIRREVFDLLGPAARATGVRSLPKPSERERTQRALRLAGTVDSLLLSALPQEPWIRAEAFRRELEGRGRLLEALRTTDGRRRGEIAASLDSGGPLGWVAGGRRSVSPVRGQIVVGAPNVVSFHAYWNVDDGAAPLRVSVVDLASNDVIALGARGDPAAVLRQGVADTAAETTILEHPPGEGSSAFEVLDAALQAGARLVVLRSPAESVPRLEASADALARIRADLTAGFLVVVPDRAPILGRKPHLAWWRVDPTTGATVGVSESGYHSDITEEAYLQNDTVIKDTVIRYRGGLKPRSFWKRHCKIIARDLGYDPENFAILEQILDIQWQLLGMGLL